MSGCRISKFGRDILDEVCDLLKNSRASSWPDAEPGEGQAQVRRVPVEWMGGVRLKSFFN